MNSLNAAKHAVAVCLMWVLGPALFAQRFEGVTVDYPDAISTSAGGINDAGDLVGNVTTRDRKAHGFLLRDGRFTLIDYPDASSTGVATLNNKGDIIGFYVDSTGKERGFVLSGGRFALIEYPGADMTRPIGINNRGDIVGMFWNRTGDTKHRGFVYTQGKWVLVEYPSPNMSCLFRINDAGDAIGHWQDADGIRHGLLWSGGKMTSFDIPGARQTMIDSGGIAANGTIAGAYRDARGKARGFLLRSGEVTRLEVPGAKHTILRNINSHGDLVGNYEDLDGISHGFRMRSARALTEVLRVDDDGADCPGGTKTIQEAVERATAGATILVCPGTYRGAVEIKGRSKDALRLIAMGREGEVVVEGDYSQNAGFVLEDVNNVLLRGFTVRYFGDQATTAERWGWGSNIRLLKAHYNTIEANQLSDSDMVGIEVTDSAHNVIQSNTVHITNPDLANCGVHIGGRGSEANFVHANLIVGNNMAGIMLSGAGAGNVIGDNTILSNGRYGITNGNTEGTRIEGNRVSYNRGPWGKTPWSGQAGAGINVESSTKVRVVDNRLRNNTGLDIRWDAKGENEFEANACSTATATELCSK
jgi:parallel beta-helix repeat protein